MDGSCSLVSDNVTTGSEGLGSRDVGYKLAWIIYLRNRRYIILAITCSLCHHKDLLVRGYSGCVFCHIAARCYQRKIVQCTTSLELQIFLMHTGSAVFIHNVIRYGQGAIVRLSQWRFGELPRLKERVRSGVDPKTARDRYSGSTPLHWACRYVPLWSSITHSDSPLYSRVYYRTI